MSSQYCHDFVENKQVQLSLVIHYVNPIKLVGFLPAVLQEKGPLLHLQGQVGVAGPQEDRQNHCLTQVNSENKGAVVKPVQAIRTSNNDLHNSLGR